MTIWNYLYKLSTISFWFDDGGCWFIAVIIPLYMVAPFWKYLLGNIKFPILPTIIIVCLMNFIQSDLSSALSQGSFFFIGYYLGKFVIEGKTLSSKSVWGIIGITILFVALYIVFGFGKLLTIIFPMTIILLCKLLELSSYSWIIRILNSLGSISLESYLFNVTLLIWIDYFGLLPGKLYAYRYVFILFCGIVLSYCVKRVSQFLIQKII